MGKVISIASHRNFGRPDPDTERLLDWLGDDVFLMKALVQVLATDIFEAGVPDDQGFVADTHCVVAQGMAVMPFGPAQPIELHFESPDWEQIEAVRARLQAGELVYVIGSYCAGLDAHPPFLSLFLEVIENIEPLPPEFVPTALRWMQG